MNRTAETIRELYRFVDEFESLYPGRKFTSVGHLVGGIAEAYAAEHYGLTLLSASASTHDAVDADGRQYQIKATGSSCHHRM